MPQLIVEIHVPLVETPGLSENDYPYPWIEEIGEMIALLDEEEGQEYDDGESFGDYYVFFITQASERSLLAVASRIAALPGVPAGVFAMVTDDAAPGFGRGRHVELPVT